MATPETDGLDPEDVAWLLEREACEILVLRPRRDVATASRAPGLVTQG
ncbi:MAG: hypothetical protein JHC84_20840 [Solirubrobacteraceae bacterium]|nr:hypothetical protein [Solirubrobacteraceae bacterium]